MKTERVYSIPIDLELETRSESEEPDYTVRGYASTFEPYVLFTRNGKDYSEQIGRNAFDEADMSDLVFRVDHEGPVYARASAGTVKVDIDDHGLHHITDLSRTTRSRELMEDLEAGNYPKMSFAFTIAEEHFDKKTNTRIIDRIAKVFDISAVTWPANPNTELSVSRRDYFDGVIEAEEAERLRQETEEKRSALLAKLDSIIGGENTNAD